MQQIRILVIDDDMSMLDLMKYQLEEQGYEVVTAECGKKGLELAREDRFDIVLTDLRLPDVDGIELVKNLKEISFATEIATEIIMITGFSSFDGAIEAIKAGAFYFLEKPIEFEELMMLIEKALERSRQTEEIKQLRGRLASRASYFNIIGSSKEMQSVYEMIDGVAESEANVMIIGESGTGKELIANAIHYKSHRAKKSFVKINCSALPRELMESELFGHTKGAFTGAVAEKNGLIAQASGGSLMLDEICEMPLELQPKLLRVLQERVCYRVGSEKALEVDFRLIAATNQEPHAAMQKGLLREDLYYRINTIEIRVPPLRERTEDIQHLATHFLQMYAEKYQRPVDSISQEVYEQLFGYSWPGNVRELQNAIERSVLLCKGNVIETVALPLAFAEAANETRAEEEDVTSTGNGANKAHPTASEQGLSFKQLGRLIISKVPQNREGAERFDIFSEMEGAIVSAALESTRGNKQAAANLLGVHRPRLYNMLRKHNLHDLSRETESNLYI
ncbi:MAG: sigma-54-dependent transcriptional regulator [Pyrinomonadaceae bacterium]